MYFPLREIVDGLNAAYCGTEIQFGRPDIPSLLLSFSSDNANSVASETASKKPNPVLAGGVKLVKAAPAGIFSG